MNKEEIVELLDQFINEIGQWNNFKKFLERQGYTLEELGFTDDD